MPGSSPSPALDHRGRAHADADSGTACWPCRQRKVKCDAQEPCTNCIKREHPQLCSYKPNQRSSSNKASGPPSRSGTRKRTLSPEAAASGRGDEKRQNDGWPRPFGTGPLLLSIQGNAPPSDQVAATSVDSDAPEPTRYLGQNSIPALIRDQPNSNNASDGSDIRSDMRPILGLDTSAPFPLMSTRHLDVLTRDITSELPSDREVMKYVFDFRRIEPPGANLSCRLFRTYKEVTQPFWGFIIDLEDFESKLMLYLEERAKNVQGGTGPTRPISATWLAILFAIMAIGSQYHDSPYHVRTRDSQKFIQISFHFLRVANFLLRYGLSR